MDSDDEKYFMYSILSYLHPAQKRLQSYNTAETSTHQKNVKISIFFSRVALRLFHLVTVL